MAGVNCDAYPDPGEAVPQEVMKNTMRRKGIIFFAISNLHE
jgi:hypothetical protein